jgi:transposase, IS5 family
MSGLDFYSHGRVTKKAKFLIEMDALVPWRELCELIEPHYPKAGKGRPPIGLERMLRLHFLQVWFNLADEACEEALYEVSVFREFAQIDLGEERVPDATSLLRFRRLLETHDLSRAMLARVNALLQARGLRVSGGTMVDATIIHAPSSTKNATQSRDPEMRQTKKGNQWYFGMKLHIGADTQTGLIHSAQTTAANVHDSQVAAWGGNAHLRRRRLRRAERQNQSGCAQRARLYQRASTTQRPAHRGAEKNQSQKERGSRRRRASVSRPQTAVGLCQDALPRSRQEHASLDCDVRALQPSKGQSRVDRISPSAVRELARQRGKSASQTMRDAHFRRSLLQNDHAIKPILLSRDLFSVSLE